MGITLGAVDRIKSGIDEVSGMVLSGGSFEGTWVGNLEDEGPGEGETLGNSEGTRVGNKIGISDGGVLYIIFIVSERIKLGVE